MEVPSQDRVLILTRQTGKPRMRVYQFLIQALEFAGLPAVDQRS